MPGANRPRGATAIRAEQSVFATLTLPRVTLTRAHAMVGLAIAGGIAIALGLSGTRDPAPAQPALEAPALVDPAPAALEPAAVDTFEREQAPLPQPWIEQAVRSGDNLSLIFKRAGYDTRDVHRVVSESEHGKGLARIYPGQTIAFQADDTGALAAVQHRKSELETVQYILRDGSFYSEIMTRDPEPRRATAPG